MGGVKQDNGLQSLQSARQGASSEFDLELYKSLRSEMAGYVEKALQFWFQKIVIVGAVVTFLLTEQFLAFPDRNRELMLAAIALMPILAILLDVKMLESAFHARAVSHFISDSFREHTAVVAWERIVWGSSGTETVRRLILRRNLATWLATVGPTVAILAAAEIAASTLSENRLSTLVPAGIVLILYLGATIVGAISLYRSSP